MKSVAYALQKGGVGKTSLAGNTGFIASQKHKTLLIDADPQGSLGSWLITEQFEYELADVIKENASFKDAALEIRPGLWIIPSFGIGGQLKTFAESDLEQFPYAFTDILKTAEGQGFELAIVDCSPGLGRLERMAMTAVDEIITPVNPEFFGLDGIDIFDDFVQTIRKRFRQSVRHEKVVANNINRSFRRHDIYMKQIRDMGYETYEIGQDSRIPEAQMMHLALPEYESESRAIPELQRLTHVILEGGQWRIKRKMI